MEKKSTKIAYFVALGVFIVLLVILGIQFKGKENPVFVGDGAFYTTGDGVFLDGIQRTVDDSTKLVITHFSHNGHLLHEELEKLANPEGFDVAYDGVVYEI